MPELAGCQVPAGQLVATTDNIVKVAEGQRTGQRRLSRDLDSRNDWGTS